MAQIIMNVGPVSTSRLYGPLWSISALLMYVYHFDVEEQSLAGERMVQIQYYGVVLDLFYNRSNSFTAGTFPIQLRAYLDPFRDAFPRDLLNRGQIFSRFIGLDNSPLPALLNATRFCGHLVCSVDNPGHDMSISFTH